MMYRLILTLQTGWWTSTEANVDQLQHSGLWMCLVQHIILIPIPNDLHQRVPSRAVWRHRYKPFFEKVRLKLVSLRGSLQEITSAEGAV
jgi:hypothetical protein